MKNPFIPHDRQSSSSGRSSSDFRWGDQLLETDEKADYVLLGYPDDEGIHLNSGRPGAALGPDKARQMLYKMTFDGFKNTRPQLFDGGNLDVSSQKDLGLRHQNAQETAFQYLQKNKKLITLGGGHDYGYPDGAAYLQYCQEVTKTRPIVINVDAHLDVRPSEKSLSSGTPFYRLLNLPVEFDFFQIGIQPQCNSKEHIDWCKSKGGQILTYEEILLSGQSFPVVASQFLGDHLIQRRPCFLSIDIDAFSSSYAMGCSQSWPTGLSPEGFFPWLDILMKRLNIVHLGIYELSPPLDLDDRTSKLVSQIAYRYLHHEG